MIMDNQQVRNIVADMLGHYHGNLEFIRQVRDGEQDDGPFMVGAFAVRDWFLTQLLPKVDQVEE